MKNARKRVVEASHVIDAAIDKFEPEELFVRLLAELSSDKAVLTRKTFFEGGDVLVCYSGCFRFVFETGSHKAVTLEPGEILVIYPGNIVSIESLKANGLLSYAIFNGSRVSDFFDTFGFYDHLKFITDPQKHLFSSAMKFFEDGNPRGALSLLQDALNTFGIALRSNGNAQLFDAIKIMHRNLAQGIVRLKPVYDELRVSRATLHRIFVAHGFNGPGEFLRYEQFRKANYLLTNTTLPIGEIGARIGIPSPVYFAEFIHKFAGVSPSELRKRGCLPCTVKTSPTAVGK